jgi:hypothetical protein
MVAADMVIVYSYRWGFADTAYQKCPGVVNVPAYQKPAQETTMKRLVLVAAIVSVAACSRGDTTADTTTPAIAPAPTTAVDTGIKTDTTKTDTTKGTKAKTP